MECVDTRSEIRQTRICLWLRRAAWSLCCLAATSGSMSRWRTIYAERRAPRTSGQWLFVKRMRAAPSWHEAASVEPQNTKSGSNAARSDVGETSVRVGSRLNLPACRWARWGPNLEFRDTDHLPEICHVRRCPRAAPSCAWRRIRRACAPVDSPCLLNTIHLRPAPDRSRRRVSSGFHRGYGFIGQPCARYRAMTTRSVRAKRSPVIRRR